MPAGDLPSAAAVLALFRQWSIAEAFAQDYAQRLASSPADAQAYLTRVTQRGKEASVLL